MIRRQRLRQLDSSRRGFARHEARSLDLGVAGAGENVLGRAAKTLLTGQPADGLTAQRQRERHVVEPEAGDFLDDIDFARDVTGTPGRHGHRPIRRDLEPETRQPGALLVIADLHPNDRVDTLRPQPNDRCRRKLSADVDVAGPPRAGERYEQLGRKTSRRLGEVWVDALLPPIRPVGTQPKPLGALQDRDGLEVRRLEQDVGRRVGDLRVLAAHDSRKRDGTLRIGDHEVARAEAARRAVERAELLALPRPANDDSFATEPLEVEGVQRVSERMHDVVRHIDDVRDRANAGADEPRLQPGRRRSDSHVAEEPADVPRAPLEILDRDVHGLVGLARGVDARHRRELQAVQGCDLARDAVDGEQVGAVGCRLELQHDVRHRENVRQRRPRLGFALEDEDSAVVGPELELALGQDHPARGLASELRLAQRLVRPRQDRARKRNGNRRPCAEVPRAADDLTRLALAHVDAAELEPVGVRMLPRLDHASDAEEAEIAVDVGDAAAHDSFDAGNGAAQPRCKVVDGHVDVDVVA